METNLDRSSAIKGQGDLMSDVVESEIPISSATLDDEFYPLDDDKKMGYCLIFNHKIYASGIKERTGTEKDVDSLTKFFGKYNFDVEVHTDKNVEEILQIVSAVAERKDLKNTSCFVCCVLTHGGESNNKDFLCARDATYSTEMLFTPFLECSALLHKPKMFFVQACRGGKRTEGRGIIMKQSLEPVLKEKYKSALMCTLPKDADFLISYSTVPGHLAYRDGNYGSWFIQELCKALNENAEELDLESILTIVRRRVALNYPNIPEEIRIDQSEQQNRNVKKKEIPSTYTTLTRKFKFTL